MQPALTAAFIRKAKSPIAVIQRGTRIAISSPFQWRSERVSLYRGDRTGEQPAHRATGIEVDARLIGAALGIEPSQVQAQLEGGKISSLCERGIGVDHGRYLLTFYYGKRRLRIVTDESGNIIDESACA
jgi:hypothetical protein